ncbi:MAG: TIGR02996 domain-containing protein [Myxococcota bacterium]
MSPGRQVVWDDAAEAAVGTLLSRANGRRTARLLTSADVRACVDGALTGPLGFSWRHAGEVDDAREFTSVVLAVAGAEDVTVGVVAARAKSVSPGRAWPELEPWERFNDAANVPRCLAWAGRRRDDRAHLSYERARRPASASRESLLEEVLAHPADEAPRLVYADWLSDRGDPRGELISVQCELERTNDPARFLELEARQVALLSAHGATWVGPLAQEALQVQFRRGFVEQVTVLDAGALEGVGELLSREPVRSLTFASTRGLDVPRLAAAPWLERLDALGLRAAHRDAGLTADEVGALLESRHLRKLSSLALRGHRLADVGALVLAANVPWALPALTAFILEHDEVSEVGAQGLASTKWLGALETLSLADNHLGEGGAEAIAFARRPGQLVSLDLSGNAVGTGGALAIAQAPRLATLEALRLARNRIGAKGVEALLESPFLTGLEVLALDGNPMGQALRRRVEAHVTAGRRS